MIRIPEPKRFKKDEIMIASTKLFAVEIGHVDKVLKDEYESA
jgi:hypothetical protein